MSTKSIALVNLLAGQTISGSKAFQRAQNFRLKSPASLEVGLFLPQFQQELPDQGSDRSISLSRLYARTSANIVRK